ncbi:hypothetical protein KFE94_07305 [bacterium SCSIO 12643]|nr:hypothetical protein KFE94_07305 [bacterium SCSIO 12643]
MKKIINIILIIIVVIIYSRLVLSHMDTEKIPNQNNIVSPKIQRSPIPTSNYTLNLNFTDPFLKHSAGAKIVSNNKTPKPQKNNHKTAITTDESLMFTSSIDLLYLGRIVNISKHESKALIKYKNKEVIVSPGDSLDSFKITEILKTHLIIQLNNKNFKYEIKK